VFPRLWRLLFALFVILAVAATAVAQSPSHEPSSSCIAAPRVQTAPGDQVRDAPGMMRLAASRAA
jgi:hypothetical protein